VVKALPLTHHILRKLFYVEIPIISSLVLFILLIAMYLTYYPVPLPRNALVYTTGYVVYFISKTALLVLINLHQAASVRTFSTILLYVGLWVHRILDDFLEPCGRTTPGVGGKQLEYTRKAAAGARPPSRIERHPAAIPPQIAAGLRCTLSRLNARMSYRLIILN
jgi:hypothetical protein